MADTRSLEEKKKELLLILNRRTRRSFRLLPTRGTTQLLNTFTLVEIDIALEELMNEQWHRDKIKELSSDYLLRGTVIDKFYQRACNRSKPNTLNTEPLVQI